MTEVEILLGFISFMLFVMFWYVREIYLIQYETWLEYKKQMEAMQNQRALGGYNEQRC